MLIEGRLFLIGDQKLLYLDRLFPQALPPVPPQALTACPMLLLVDEQKQPDPIKYPYQILGLQ